MVFATGAMDDYVRRLGIGEAGAIPCSARSLTLEEARAADRGHILWGVSVVVFFTFLYGSIALIAEAEPRDMALLGATMGALALIVAIMAWWRIRKRRTYVDPRIEIEVAEDAVTVATSAGAENRRYDALIVSELLSRATKSSRHFTGIVLETRLGPLRLEDDWYRDGKAAAGAILKRLDALGLPLDRGRA